jgi:endoglycosylceramidase
LALLAIALCADKGGGLRAAQAAPLRVSGSHFVDGAGAVILLRGVNLAGESKVPPYRHLRSLSDLDPLPGWGVNVLRLLFNWEAYEPMPGSYRDSYLAGVTQIAEEAWKRGIYVLIDIHQDAFSRFNIGGCGDGFPVWALPPDIRPQTPDNGATCASWGMRMIVDRDLHRTFSAFHQNQGGVRDRYLLLLSRLAQHFRSHPGILGFDPINEPWGDEKKELPALYADAERVIRKEFPDAILFLEGHALNSSGLVSSALPRPAFSNYAYAPHYYEAGVLIGHSYSGLSLATDAAFALIDRKTSELSAPLFLGEYGAPGGTRGGDSYLTLLHRHLNQRFASGAQWNYTPGWDPLHKDGWNREDLSIVDDRGQLRGELFRPRPYPQRIAGTPVQLRVREASALTPYALELAWDHDPRRGETLIFAPQSLFRGRPPSLLPIVETEGAGLSCRYDADRLRLRCTSSDAGRKQVTVRSCQTLGPLCL